MRQGRARQQFLHTPNPHDLSQWSVKRAWRAINAIIISLNARRSLRDASVVIVGGIKNVVNCANAYLQDLEFDALCSARSKEEAESPSQREHCQFQIMPLYIVLLRLPISPGIGAHVHLGCAILSCLGLYSRKAFRESKLRRSSTVTL